MQLCKLHKYPLLTGCRTDEDTPVKECVQALCRSSSERPEQMLRKAVAAESPNTKQ